MSDRTIEEVLQANTEKWMAIPGVVGTAIGKCGEEVCIRVFVARKTPEIAREIPSRVEGYIVDIEETGPFEARDTSRGAG